MTKFAAGVTLTPEERAMMGPPNTKQSNSGGPVIRHHTLETTLPGGIKCQVDYRRPGQASHNFEFHTPIGQTLWTGTFLEGTIAAIKREATSCGLSAFLMAQEKEQKDMRSRSAPKGS